MTKHLSAAPQAVRMHPPRGPESFPPEDPRAGFYQPGVSYVIGRDVSAEKAACLVQEGGYTYCKPDEAPAASETEPEPPAKED
jgi:hypothetical protein